MPYVACLFNSLTRFAVPCFIMISGAFILDNEKTRRCKSFYKDSYYKIGIHIVVFTIIYALYKIPFIFVGNVTGLDGFIEWVTNLITGNIVFHMWYVYMLVGLYILAPFVKHIIDEVSIEYLNKFSICFFVLSCMSRWTTSEITLSYDAGQTFEYLSFFLIGYCLRKNSKIKNNGKGIFFIIIGILFEIIASFLEYNQIIYGISESELQYKIVSPWCPLIAMATIFVFYGFTILDIDNIQLKHFRHMVNMSFYIYLIHAGVWDVLSRFICIVKPQFFIEYNPWVGIIGLSSMVFSISLVLSLIYNGAFNFMRYKIIKNI